MNIKERLPGLEALSDAEKDTLIHNLWEDLRQQNARVEALAKQLAEFEQQSEMGGTTGRDLLAELQKAKKQRAPPSKSEVKVKLGRGLGVLRSRLIIGGLGFIIAATTFDYALGRYQIGQLEEMRIARMQLERAANSGLLVEIRNLTYEPDGKSFRLTIETRNLDPQQPIFIMMSPVRVFEQSGLIWREVPARSPPNQASRVVKLTDSVKYETVFEPHLANWAELMPGYMHIRFENNRLISQRSEPEDDIVERRDRFYVYLKPHNADNERIRTQMKFPGEPPVFIPMPPH